MGMVNLISRGSSWTTQVVDARTGQRIDDVKRVVYEQDLTDGSSGIVTLYLVNGQEVKRTVNKAQIEGVQANAREAEPAKQRGRIRARGAGVAQGISVEPHAGTDRADSGNETEGEPAG